MLSASLVQTTNNQLPPAMVAALLVVALVSVLALVVSLRIARRIRAIGDQEESIADDQSPTNARPSETDG